MEDNREDFRQAIFDVVENLTKHRLSARGKDLILHYFNDSQEASSLLRAFDAIEKYYPESMPAEEDRSPKLARLIETLKQQAQLWDSE
ncbi:MAG TPA: hypothetical protein PK926_06055 [Spirochaetota bacterium]|nr:hypothetical protein [Spirochaetota bacterium]HPI87672.1 hypothetical protein [Spirochaetota bacterium]HPR49715.1 hypothetical protein [Spirochaetota bacterium]